MCHIWINFLGSVQGREREKKKLFSIFSSYGKQFDEAHILYTLINSSCLFPCNKNQ